MPQWNPFSTSASTLLPKIITVIVLSRFATSPQTVTACAMPKFSYLGWELTLPAPVSFLPVNDSWISKITIWRGCGSPFWESVRAQIPPITSSTIPNKLLITQLGLECLIHPKSIWPYLESIIPTQPTQPIKPTQPTQQTQPIQPAQVLLKFLI